jgi:hypothetical protein
LIKNPALRDFSLGVNSAHYTTSAAAAKARASDFAGKRHAARQVLNT